MGISEGEEKNPQDKHMFDKKDEIDDENLFGNLHVLEDNTLIFLLKIMAGKPSPDVLSKTGLQLGIGFASYTMVIVFHHTG
jgi:hypothetical protein